MKAHTDGVVQCTKPSGEPQALWGWQGELRVEDNAGGRKLLGGHPALVALVVRKSRANLSDAKLSRVRDEKGRREANKP